jgi:SAM-dependent methyltransferase
VAPVSEVAPANAETNEAWSGPLFERFVAFRSFISPGLAAHADVALAAHPPGPGERVLEIGCGYGDTTRRLAQLVGDDGHVVGVDISEPFLNLAREEAAELGIANVEYRFGDAQIADLGGPYDYVFSRMGVMFFADPVAALANIRSAMRPGARFCVVVWRRKVDNGWTWEAEKVAQRYIERPEGWVPPPADAPGPFSMTDADQLSGRLAEVGFEAITLRRCDIPMRLGGSLDEAVATAVGGVGPAVEAMRLLGDRAEEFRPRIEAEVREALAPFDTGDGVFAPSSTWIVSATA